LTRSIFPFRERIVKCSCGENFTPLTKQVIKEGRIVTDLPSPQKIRKYVLEQLNQQNNELEE
ncbi:hypothetical protein LCGC14_2177390, partial [marine sediment metagenome]